MHVLRIAAATLLALGTSVCALPFGEDTAVLGEPAISPRQAWAPMLLQRA